MNVGKTLPNQSYMIIRQYEQRINQTNEEILKTESRLAEQIEWSQELLFDATVKQTEIGDLVEKDK